MKVILNILVIMIKIFLFIFVSLDWFVFANRSDLNFISHLYLYIMKIKIEVRNLIAENKLIHHAGSITILINYIFN